MITRKTRIKIDAGRWCEIAIELRDDPARPVLSITGSEGSILTRAAARGAARDYWREFLDENPGELVRMQKEYGVRSAAGAARKVVEIDGEFHGLDVHRELGDQVLITESCGQITDDLAQWFPFCRPWLPFHLNNLRAGCEHQRAGGWQSCPGYHRNGEICAAPELPFPEVRIATHSSTERQPKCPATWIAVPKLSPHTENISGEETPRCPVCAQKARGSSPLTPYWAARAIVEGPANQRERCRHDALSVPCPVCGYRFGTSWLYEPIPLVILLELRAFLADAPATPAGAWE